MSWSRILGIAVFLFILFFIVTRPQTAAAFVTSLWNGILYVFNGLSSFFQSL